ncbi:MAG: hypothetical protein ACFFC3_11805 [Candidatus Odinarchaeota archaeon]
MSHIHLDHIIDFYTLNKFRFIQGIKIIGYSSIKESLTNIIRHPYTTPFDHVLYPIEIIEIKEQNYEKHIPFLT